MLVKTMKNGTDTLEYTYDEIGNLLTYRNGMSFTWQNGRQLSSITKDGAELASYTYNAEGLRTSKTAKNGTGESTYYYEFNVQGDVIGIINSGIMGRWIIKDAIKWEARLFYHNILRCIQCTKYI